MAQQRALPAPVPGTAGTGTAKGLDDSPALPAAEGRRSGGSATPAREDPLPDPWDALPPRNGWTVHEIVGTHCPFCHHLYTLVRPEVPVPGTLSVTVCEQCAPRLAERYVQPDSAQPETSR
ncbi:hypothetical protein [Streptomyces lydicus]|uniref:hypothetical protein n=1 Tax=Streptomyces lydicus TaxID=47763 RepID=UPI0034493C41